MTRKRLSTRDRVQCFEDGNGSCHICGLPIQAGEKWEVSHPQPLALGGEDVRANRRPAHFRCHRAWTAAEDQPRIAKAKRQHAKHIGAKAPAPRPLRSRNDFPARKAPRIPKRPLPMKPLYQEETKR